MAISYRHSARRGHSGHVPMRQRRPNVEVEVKDFGPIAKGKVELRPLTVFAGPSNTGKSWLAILIYALWKALPVSTTRSSLSPLRHISKESVLKDELNRLGMSFFPENPELWNKAIQNKSAIRLTKKEQALISSLLHNYQKQVGKEILRCYGMAEPEKAIRWEAGSAAKIGLRIGPLHHNLMIENKSENLSFSIKHAPNFALGNILKDRENWLETLTGNKEDDWHGIASNLEMCIGNSYELGEVGDIHYLPADRGGIMHAHATVVTSLIDSAADVGLHNERYLPTLSGVLGDFMKNLVRMADDSNRDRQAVHILEAGLTENVLSGTMRIDRSKTGYPRFVYWPSGRKESLSLINVSSMVSDLGPLALFLRHCVSLGDLLIIEEPEAHLHPELQQLLIVELVELVRMGVRIALTTHSDWILSELSNVVARSTVRQRNALEDDEAALSKEDVGVWRFDKASGNRTSNGSSIAEVKWDPNGGGYEAGFYDVLVKQNNDWASIMSHYEWPGEEE